jgi:hypothetical protein
VGIHAGTRRFGGKPYPPKRLARLKRFLAARGIELKEGLLPGRGAFAQDGAEMVLPSNLFGKFDDKAALDREVKEVIAHAAQAVRSEGVGGISAHAARAAKDVRGAHGKDRASIAFSKKSRGSTRRRLN